MTEDVQFARSQRVFFPGLGLEKTAAAAGSKTIPPLAEKTSISQREAVKWCYAEPTCVGFEWDSANGKATFRALTDIASVAPYKIVANKYWSLGHIEDEGDHLREGRSAASFKKMEVDAGAANAAKESGTFFLCDFFVDLELVLNKTDSSNLFLDVYSWQRIFEESSLYGKAGETAETLKQVVNLQNAAVKTERQGTHNLLPSDGWVTYRGKYGWFNAEPNADGVVQVKHSDGELAAAATSSGDETVGLREKSAWGVFDTHQNPHGVHAGSGGYLLPHRLWEYRWIGNYALGLSWYAGEALCQRLGGHLMKITLEDDAILTALMAKQGHDAWAGIDPNDANADPHAGHDHLLKKRSLQLHSGEDHSGETVGEPLSPWLGLIEQPANNEEIGQLIERLDAMAAGLEWTVEKQFVALSQNDPDHFWTHCWASKKSRVRRELQEDDHSGHDHAMRGSDEAGHGTEETKPWLDVATCYDAELARHYEVLDSIHQALDVLRGYGRQFAWVHGKGRLASSNTETYSSDTAATAAAADPHAGHGHRNRKLAGDDAALDITTHLASFGEFMRFGHNQPDQHRTGKAQGCFYASHGYAFYDTECHAPEQKRPVICAREVSYACERDLAHAGHDHRQRRQLLRGAPKKHEKRAALIARSRLARAVASREQRIGLRRLRALWAKVAKAQKSIKDFKIKKQGAIVSNKEKDQRALAAGDGEDAVPALKDNAVCSDPLYASRGNWAAHFATVYKKWLGTVAYSFDTWDAARRGKEGESWLNEWEMGASIEPREADKLVKAGMNQVNKPWVLKGTYQIPLASASEAVINKLKAMLAAKAAEASILGGGATASSGGHDDHSGHDHRQLTRALQRDDAFEALVTEHIKEAVWRGVADWSTLWEKEIGKLGDSGAMYEEARSRYLDIYSMSEIVHDDHSGKMPLAEFSEKSVVLPTGYAALSKVFESELARGSVDFYRITLKGDFKVRIHNKAVAQSVNAQAKAMSNNRGGSYEIMWRCVPRASAVTTRVDNCAQEFATAWHRAYDAIKTRVRGYGASVMERLWIWDLESIGLRTEKTEGFRV